MFLLLKFRAKTATVLVLKDFDESPVTYDGALTQKDLVKWVKTVAYPPFAILDQCARSLALGRNLRAFWDNSTDSVCK